MSEVVSPDACLYVALLFEGSTAKQRQHALESLGASFIAFDHTRYANWGPGLLRSFTHRFSLGPATSLMNREIRRVAKTKRPAGAWIDKGVWIGAKTLTYLRANCPGPLIHYTPDAAFVVRAHCTPQFRSAIPLYDLMITTKSHEVAEYKRRGARDVAFIHQGFDPAIFRPYDVSGEDRATFASDVCFVGRCEPHYVECLAAAAEATDDLGIWGHWKQTPALPACVADAIRGGAVWEANYCKVLCSAKIALGLLSRKAQDQSTTRTFEIPACGAFMLAERTVDHQSLFEEDREAVFFTGLDELRDKIRYYLRHDVERERIAARGRERCLRSDYTWQGQFQKIAPNLRKLGLPLTRNEPK